MVSELQVTETTQIRRELAGRDLRAVSPRVIAVEELEDSGDALAVTPPEGSIVVYYAAAESGALLDAIASALVERDAARLRELGGRVLTTFRAQRRITEAEMPQARQDLLALPCLFEVRYGNRAVAGPIGLLYGNPFGTVTLGYNGPIEDRELSIAEYHAANSGAGYSYLVARRAPELSELERLVLEHLPASVGQFDLAAMAKPTGDTFQQVADVAKQMVADARATKKGTMPFLPLLNERLRTQEISLTASAQTLARARRELMARSER